MITHDLDLLTVEEAADILRVSRPTIRRWVKAGRLPAIRVGPRHLRIRRGELTRVEKRATPETPSASGEGAETDEELLEGGRRLKAYLEREDFSGSPWILSVRQHLLDMLEARGGMLLPSSVPLIREARDEGYEEH